MGRRGHPLPHKQRGCRALPRRAARGCGAFHLHSVSLFQPVGGTQGVHPLARHPHHRRPAHLCGDGLRRRVGRARNVPARRPPRAHEVWPASRRTTSARTGSSGATPSTTTTPWREDGFGWWIRRIGGAQKLYDVIRIDHFRGFESYWAIPYGETTAKNGRWVKGPGMSLVGVLTGWFRDLDFIAEDLGYPSPEVVQLLSDSGLPGMKVLEFAFDSRDPSDYLPHSLATSTASATPARTTTHPSPSGARRRIRRTSRSRRSTSVSMTRRASTPASSAAA